MDRKNNPPFFVAAFSEFLHFKIKETTTSDMEVNKKCIETKFSILETESLSIVLRKKVRLIFLLKKKKKKKKITHLFPSVYSHTKNKNKWSEGRKIGKQFLKLRSNTKKKKKLIIYPVLLISINQKSHDCCLQNKSRAKNQNFFFWNDYTFSTLWTKTREKTQRNKKEEIKKWIEKEWNACISCWVRKAL